MTSFGILYTFLIATPQGYYRAGNVAKQGNQNNEGPLQRKASAFCALCLGGKKAIKENMAEGS